MQSTLNPKCRFADHAKDVAMQSTLNPKCRFADHAKDVAMQRSIRFGGPRKTTAPSSTLGETLKAVADEQVMSPKP
jgi:hypothetical protein